MTPSPAFASTLSRHSESAGQSWKVSNAQLLAAIHPVAAQRQAAAAKAAASRPAKYTVRSGDTLSTIAGKVYHDPDAWPVLYWANRDKIRWANSVDAGQVLTVPVKPARIPAAPSQLGPTPAPVPRAGQHGADGNGAAGVGRGRRARAEREHLHRLRLLPGVRDLERVRWQQPGHELQRALRPVPVQLLDLG